MRMNYRYKYRQVFFFSLPSNNTTIRPVCKKKTVKYYFNNLNDNNLNVIATYRNLNVIVCTNLTVTKSGTTNFITN